MMMSDVEEYFNNFDYKMNVLSFNNRTNILELGYEGVVYDVLMDFCNIFKYKLLYVELLMDNRFVYTFELI